jgi:hypothetical protein
VVTGLKHQKEKRSMDHFAGLDVSVKERHRSGDSTLIEQLALLSNEQIRGHHCCTITVAPIFVRLYRSMMSSLDSRMQPEDTPPPSFQGSFVP